MARYATGFGVCTYKPELEESKFKLTHDFLHDD